MRVATFDSTSRPVRSVLRRLLGVGAAVGVLLAVGGGTSFAAAAAPSSQDSMYMMANAQTSLAEITIGQSALSKAQDQQSKALATTTIADHQAALAKLKTVAAAAGVSLPSMPNAAQQADAATLKATSAASFDLTYAQIQVAGHQLSIAATNTEISSGTDPAVVAYAQGYLPVASMHLSMAQQLLTALGGTPTAVPAGNGGQAAQDPAGTTGIVVISLGALLLLGGALLLLRRRFGVSSRHLR